MIIQIQTKYDGFPTIEIDDNLFMIFREDFETQEEAKEELMSSFAGTCCHSSDLPDMVNGFMVGWLQSVVRRQRGL